MAKVLPPVAGLVDAVAPGRGVAATLFPRADPDNARVGLVDRDVPDRSGTVVVEDRRPSGSSARGLPDASGGGAHHHVRPVVLEGVDGGDPSALVPVSDVPPLQIPHQALLELLGAPRLHDAGEGEEGARGDQPKNGPARLRTAHLALLRPRIPCLSSGSPRRRVVLPPPASSSAFRSHPTLSPFAGGATPPDARKGIRPAVGNTRPPAALVHHAETGRATLSGPARSHRFPP